MKNSILRIRFSRNNPSTSYLSNETSSTASGKTYYPELQVIVLIQLAEDDSYTIYRILPRQFLSSANNKLPAYKGKSYKKCLKRQCLKNMALKLYGLQTEDLTNFSFRLPQEEDLALWKTDPYVKAILNNQQER